MAAKISKKCIVVCTCSLAQMLVGGIPTKWHRDFLSIMKHLSYSTYELCHFLAGNNHKNTPKSMLELTFAEIALPLCGYLYKEHILKNSSRMEQSI